MENDGRMWRAALWLALCLFWTSAVRAETRRATVRWISFAGSGSLDSTRLEETMDFPKYSGGGLNEVRVQVQLSLYQFQAISGSCQGESDCASSLRVRQSIEATPEIVIAPAGMPKVPVPVPLGGQTQQPNLLDLPKNCDGSTCQALRERTVGGTAQRIIREPALLSAFSGTGSVPIRAAIRFSHSASCSWIEEDDSFLLFVDFLEIHSSCNALSSEYQATALFTVTVEYSAATGGFFELTPTAVAGGPYFGLSGLPIEFDASGSLVGASDTVRYGIVRYEWDFDSDGVFDASSPQPLASHVYPRAYRGSASLRVTRSDGAVGDTTASVEVRSRSDLDGDGDTDLEDLDLLLADLRSPVAASGCGEACDLDGDGVITALDARILVTQCSQPGCAGR